LALALPLSLTAIGVAQAQQVPQGTAPTREEIERPPSTATPPPRARLTVEGDVERAPCALDRPEYQNIRFTPTEITFEDLKGLSAADLRPAYASYLGTEQPVSVVCEIRDRAATILRNAGYIASVEVPEQRIADGHLRFQVLMAKIVAVRVRGDAGRAEKRIASYLNRLTQDEVFNRYRAERYLLLASDLPGYSVRLALRSAGQARGEVVGEVTVLYTPVMIDAAIQNYGSHAAGRWGGNLRAQFFGLTGMGDRTTISAYSTADFDEQTTVQLGHEFRVGSQGLTFSGQFTYSWTHPDIDIPNVDIKSKTLFATIEAAYPFIRSQSRNVRGSVGLDLANQDVDFNGLDLSRDRTRVAYAKIAADFLGTNFTSRHYNLAEPPWRVGGEIELRQGLDILGGNRDCRDNPVACTLGGRVPPARLDADPTATVLRGVAYAEIRPIPRLTFAFGARGQTTSSPLLSFEQFSAGNYTIGRGYDPGTLQGDRGVGLQGEVRFGSVVPRDSKSIRIEPFAFVDQAWVWHEKTAFSAIGRQELTSVGGGVRAAIGDQFRVDLSYAEPLDHVGIGGRKPGSRLLLSLSTRLWPWSFR
jgi:hemolysin activation/secretion protein